MTGDEEKAQAIIAAAEKLREAKRLGKMQKLAARLDHKHQMISELLKKESEGQDQMIRFL